MSGFLEVIFHYISLTSEMMFTFSTASSSQWFMWVSTNLNADFKCHHCCCDLRAARIPNFYRKDIEWIVYQLFLSASAPHAKYILVTTEVSLCQVELRTTWRKMSGQGPNELRTKFASSNTYEDFSYMLQYVHIKKMYLFLTYSSAIFPG